MTVKSKRGLHRAFDDRRYDFQRHTKTKAPANRLACQLRSGKHSGKPTPARLVKVSGGYDVYARAEPVDHSLKVW